MTGSSRKNGTSYYFGMSSTPKKVIDRFYSIDQILREKKNKAVLISVQHSVRYNNPYFSYEKVCVSPNLTYGGDNCNPIKVSGIFE